MARIIDLAQSFFKHVFFPLFTIIALFPLLLYLITVVSDLKLNTDELYFCFKFTICFVLYAYASITIGFLFNQIFKGPKNVDGCVPEYASNGFSFFVVTLSLTYYFCNYHLDYVVHLVTNYLALLLVFDIFGLILCVYLCYAGYDFVVKKGDSEMEIQMKKFYSEEREKEKKEGDMFAYNILFLLYRGMRFHPTILGVDVKQLINCRFGLVLWQVLIWFFYAYSIAKYENNNVLFFSNVLQTLYLGKFYWWETGYFNTLDITLDRGGYYILWGCILIVPSLYTFTSFVLAANPLEKDLNQVMIFFVTALLFLCLNYYADYEKESFQYYRSKVLDKIDLAESNDEDQDSVIETIEQYNTTYFIKSKGGWKWLEENKSGIRSKLLMSGLWGIVRKLNYTFELIFSFIIGFLGPFFSGYERVQYWGLLYISFLFILLVGRIGRDNTKCLAKYGNLWRIYTERVPYSLIYGIY